RHTRLQGDWSSDVCSSDLTVSRAVNQSQNERFEGRDSAPATPGEPRKGSPLRNVAILLIAMVVVSLLVLSGVIPRLRARSALARSEERRVGKECRSGWAQC